MIYYCVAVLQPLQPQGSLRSQDSVCNLSFLIFASCWVLHWELRISKAHLFIPYKWRYTKFKKSKKN